VSSSVGSSVGCLVDFVALTGFGFGRSSELEGSVFG
jgi:hypothetical protein